MIRSDESPHRMPKPPRAGPAAQPIAPRLAYRAARCRHCLDVVHRRKGGGRSPFRAISAASARMPITTAADGTGDAGVDLVRFASAKDSVAFTDGRARKRASPRAWPSNCVAACSGSDPLLCSPRWAFSGRAGRRHPSANHCAQRPAGSRAATSHPLGCSALAPASVSEIAAWILVCALAGFAEEIVFRGYLQRQFTAWGRGALWAGVVFSAILFGMAHGYQGARNMVLLSIFGALFSLLAIFRRSLRAGMIAHSWHDLVAGLATRAASGAAHSSEIRERISRIHIEKLLPLFPLSIRFFLDTCACMNLYILQLQLHVAESMQPIEKGE